jgi:hypothetical protein
MSDQHDGSVGSLTNALDHECQTIDHLVARLAAGKPTRKVATHPRLEDLSVEFPRVLIAPTVEVTDVHLSEGVEKYRAF